MTVFFAIWYLQGAYGRKAEMRVEMERRGGKKKGLLSKPAASGQGNEWGGRRGSKPAAATWLLCHFWIAKTTIMTSSNENAI